MNRFAIMALACWGLLAAPASAEVVSQGPSSFVTRDSAVVSAEPREVWLALISPDKWWNDAHTWSGDAANMSITPQGGGCFCERIPAEETRNTVGLEGSAQHMTVVQASPDKALRMRGGLGPLQSEPAEGVLTVTLQKVDQGTRITFEYVVGGAMRFKTPKISSAVDGVMSQQLNGLAELLGKVDVPVPEASPAASADTDADGADDTSSQDKPDDNDAVTAEPAIEAEPIGR